MLQATASTQNHHPAPNSIPAMMGPYPFAFSSHHLMRAGDMTYSAYCPMHMVSWVPEGARAMCRGITMAGQEYSAGWGGLQGGALFSSCGWVAKTHLQGVAVASVAC